MSDFPELTPPWSRLPLVHDDTDLFPAPTMDALSATFVGVPVAAENTVFLTPRGSDSNDGRTLKSAKLTLAGAVSALGGVAGKIMLGAGQVDGNAAPPDGSTIEGLGNRVSKIVMTGTGAAITTPTPGTRTYGLTVKGVWLEGPGKTTAGSIGLNLDSISTASFQDVLIRNFETGVKIHSTTSGGSVYNRFYNVDIRSCGTGLDIKASGSNATTFIAGRVLQNDIGIQIVDSNENHIIASQIEGNTLGVKIDASAPALADHNEVVGCRFEGNTTAWEVTSSNVRQARILYPMIFGTYTYTDNGDRTLILSNSLNQYITATTTSVGNWIFRRTSSGGSENPAMCIEDTASGSGTPVTLLVKTERPGGYAFRVQRASTKYLDVDSSGNLYQYQGAFHELGDRGTTPGTPTAAVRLFSSSGVLKYVDPAGTVRNPQLVITSTTAALAAIGNAINTTGKQQGLMVYNTTTKKPVWADGATAGSVWVDATGATAHTPV